MLVRLMFAVSCIFLFVSFLNRGKVYLTFWRKFSILGKLRSHINPDNRLFWQGKKTFTATWRPYHLTATYLRAALEESQVFEPGDSKSREQLCLYPQVPLSQHFRLRISTSLGEVKRQNRGDSDIHALLLCTVGFQDWRDKLERKAFHWVGCYCYFGLVF